MEGFNPYLDAMIVAGVMLVMIIVAYIGDKYFPIKKKQAPRGATRI